MWNKIVFLIGMRADIDRDEESRELHSDNLISLTSFLQKAFPRVTVEEIEQAYEMAVKGELPNPSYPSNGESAFIKAFPLLNPLQVSQIIGAYLKYRHVNMAKAYREQKLLSLPEVPVPTPEQHNKNLIDLLRKAFSTIEAGEMYNDWGNVLYDALDAKKLIHFSVEEKHEFIAQARQEEILEANRKINEVRHTIFFKAASKVLEGLESETGIRPTWIPKAKNFALNRLIHEQILAGIDANSLWSQNND
ncbi:hypothetical protein [Runella zeae]|uniref:hypothetical protein n=1 Tax=Runella zeae TaxID=94255 RepID=UPI00048A5893|nr:hypothetical protein [Runella zeae]